jgi:flagellin FlaB
MGKHKKLVKRLIGEQKGITGLETAIILIAFVVVASVFAYTTLSAGMFATGKSQEAINAGLHSVQDMLELRGSIYGYRDTLNSGSGNSLGRVDMTVTVFSDSSQVDLTTAYSIDNGTGALINSNPGINRLQIAFSDQKINIPDCAWTVVWIGKNNGDSILESSEKAVISVWLHDFNGAAWGPAMGEGPRFLGTNYVDTYHKFTLEVKTDSGPVLTLERTTPAYLDKVIDLR